MSGYLLFACAVLIGAGFIGTLVVVLLLIAAHDQESQEHELNAYLDAMQERYDARRHCERCGVATDGRYAWCDDCQEHGTCPHGNPPADCAVCDVASDLAFDSGREARG